MREDLRALGEVQVLDKEIDRLEELRDSIPVAVEKLRLRIEEHHERIKEQQAKLAGRVKERRAKERELDTLEEKAKKFQAQLYQVKTNKEYTALLHEVDGVKEASFEIEESVLGLMEEGDELEKLIVERTRSLEKEEQEVREEEEVLRSRLAETEKAVERIAEMRRSKAAGVDPGLLVEYERVRKGRGGVGLVPVRDNCCQGCFMEVRPQLLNELMGSELVSCEMCSRLLYLEPEEK